MSVAKYVNVEDMKSWGSCLYGRSNCRYDNKIHCEDCHYHGVYFDAIKELTPFISCNDELPSDDDCYLVIWIPRHKDGTKMEHGFYYGICWFDIEEQKFDRNDIMDKYYTSRDIDFLAWMPLPYYERED